MRFPLLTVFLCLAVLAGGPAPAAATDAVERLQQFHTEVRSLEASFSQTLVDSQGETLQRSEGRVWLQRPGRFRWDYTEPYPQVVLGDGEKVWIYDAELEQVTIKALGEAVSSAPMLVLSGRRSLEADFEIRDLGARGELQWAELTPKDGEGDFRRVRIGFGETLREMELEDNFGQLSRIVFRDVRVNPRIPPDRFRLEIPEGVDVVGGSRES